MKDRALAQSNPGHAADTSAPVTREVIRAWIPWLILSILVFLWGIPQVRAWLDGISVIRIPVPGLHLHVFRTPPVVPTPAAEAAVFNLNWLSATGTGIFMAAILAGLVMGRSIGELARAYARTLALVSMSLLTISAMMALGFTTRYSGLDATLGLAFASTGCCIRSLARCSDGSAWLSRDPTLHRMCYSEVCSASRPNNSV